MDKKKCIVNANDLTDFALDGSLKEKKLKVSSNHGYTIAPQKVIRCFRLSELEKLILLELFSYLGRNGYAFPSHNYLALKLGKKSTSSVKNALKSLKLKGMLYWYHGGGDFGTNHYYIPDLSKSPYLILSEATHFYIDTVLKEYRNKISYNKLYGTILNFVEKPKCDLNTANDPYGLVIKHLQEYPHEENSYEFYSIFLTLLNDEIYNKTSFDIEIDWNEKILDLFNNHFPDFIENRVYPSLLQEKFHELWESEKQW
jgi:Helix-turn-helix domain